MNVVCIIIIGARHQVIINVVIPSIVRLVYSEPRAG